MVPKSEINSIESGRSFSRKFETVTGGFVTPTVIDDGLIAGCVYQNDGTKVDLSERFGGWMGDLFRSHNSKFIERPPCTSLPGKGVYLGAFMSVHYGHFITETLATFWIFEEIQATEFDYFLISPFVFGSKIPDYALRCFRAFGIDPTKVVLMGEQAIAFDELVVPERLLRLNHSADPSLRWVYRTISSRSGAAGAPCERIYLSRRKLSRRNLTRVIANEVMVEKLFRQAGFRVIYPEELPFDIQLGLYDRAMIVAGPSGSALHNSLFMKSGAKLIELGDPRYGGERAPTQMLCDTISGVDTALIPFVGKLRDVEKSMSINLDDLRGRLIQVLKEMDVSSLCIETSKIRMSPSDAIEIIYLSYRPLLGVTLRKLLRLFGIKR